MERRIPTDQELISVIVPVYNAAWYLPKCLDSICGQTYENLEIILVNDGSTDESGRHCDEYAGKDSRIRVLHRENSGVSSARNLGLKAAAGSLIGFVDADDWIEPQMYAKLSEAICGADMACCGYVDYPMDTLDCPVSKGVRVSPVCSPVEAAMRIYERDGYFTAIWNKLYRKEIIKANGGFIMMNPALFWGEDEVWLAQVLRNCRRVAFVPEALYHWRPTEVSATRNTVVTEKQMTLLTAKQQAMQLLPQDEALQELVRARMFNDCYDLKVRAYVSGDRNKYEEVSKVLAEMKKAWIRSSDPSLIRKIKVQIMEAEISIGLPGRIVQSTDHVRRYGVKR